jgi:hypothetical protein
MVIAMRHSHNFLALKMKCTKGGETARNDLSDVHSNTRMRLPELCSRSVGTRIRIEGCASATGRSCEREPILASVGARSTIAMIAIRVCGPDCQPGLPTRTANQECQPDSGFFALPRVDRQRAAGRRDWILSPTCGILRDCRKVQIFSSGNRSAFRCPSAHFNPIAASA